VGLLGFTIACDGPLSPVPTDGSIKFSIKGVNSTSSTALAKSVSVVTITSARIVIDEIEFESSHEDSIDFELEDPFVQDLVVDSVLHEISTIQVPFGIYEELEIEIDELDDEESSAFRENSDLQNLSIRVEGFLDNDMNNTFVFTSDFSEEQEREFDPPLTIDENSPSTNLVLTIDMGLWFVDQDSNPLDPNLAENKSAIERNIKASLKVFEDEDDDGEEDDDDDDDDD
jgi:hypothetical protein